MNDDFKIKKAVFVMSANSSILHRYLNMSSLIVK